MPDPKVETAVDLAKRLGTLDADDRSNQYPLLNEKLVHKAVNEAWAKVHQLEREGRAKDKEIAKWKSDTAGQIAAIKGRYAVAVAVVTGILARGPEITRFLWTLFR